MRRTCAAIIVAALGTFVPAGIAEPATPGGAGVSPAAKKPPVLKLTMSNFRFCEAESCTPLDIGYLRPQGTRIEGTDNPLAAVDVKRGTIVTWVYRDASCDQFECGGHNVYFENGKAGVKKGFVPSNKGPKSMSVKITQKAGTTIRYFCTVNGHDQTGMTGILNVT
jgi:plastocyanin